MENNELGIENDKKEKEGGEEEQQADDTSCWYWASAVAEGIPPCARGGHSATLVGSSLVIFGGHYYQDKTTGFVYLNDTHFLDVKKSKWIKPYCPKNNPPPRYNHTAVYAAGFIIIFAGKGPKTTVYNDLYTFNPKTYEWNIGHETGEAPSPRFGHTAELYNGKMYVFGGWNGKNYFNDVCVLDLEKNAWFRPQIDGAPPCPRQGHASCLVGNCMIIQGGFYFDEAKYKKNYNNYGTFLKSCYLNDIKFLDLDTNQWKVLETNGQPPQPRFGHTMSFVKGQIIIFGGWSNTSGKKFNTINEALEEGNKTKTSYTGTKTGKKTDSKKPTVDLNEETDYFYSLNFKNAVWSKSSFGGDLPTCRYGHSATIFKHNILFFGGWEFGKSSSDICVLLAK